MTPTRLARTRPLSTCPIIQTTRSSRRRAAARPSQQPRHLLPRRPTHLRRRHCRHLRARASQLALLCHCCPRSHSSQAHLPRHQGPLSRPTTRIPHAVVVAMLVVRHSTILRLPPRLHCRRPHYRRRARRLRRCRRACAHRL